jgi:hemerythrin-like domain-containing protein
MEHEELRARKRALKTLLDERKTLDRSYLVSKLRELGMYIVLTLNDHIYEENNILYPFALRIIPEKEWDRIKEGV